MLYKIPTRVLSYISIIYNLREIHGHILGAYGLQTFIVREIGISKAFESHPKIKRSALSKTNHILQQKKHNLTG